MLTTVLALVVILGTASSAPSDVVAYPSYELAVHPDTITLIFDIIKSIIGHKVSLLSLAVTTIEWVVSNFFVIAFGATAVLGFCKLTGKCSLDYNKHPTIINLKNLVTSEHLDTAERFLITAVEKYAEKRKRET